MIPLRIGATSFGTFVRSFMATLLGILESVAPGEQASDFVNIAHQIINLAFAAARSVSFPCSGTMEGDPTPRPGWEANRTHYSVDISTLCLGAVAFLLVLLWVQSIREDTQFEHGRALSHPI